MPHFLVIFTRRKITKATMRKVIDAPMKCPTRKGPATMFSHSMPGMARVTMGMIRSSTSAFTKSPRYMPMMKATARPMTLYFEKKSMNSLHKPFGGGGAGLGSSNSLIRLNSSNISSSLDMYNHNSNLLSSLFLKSYVNWVPPHISSSFKSLPVLFCQDLTTYSVSSPYEQAKIFSDYETLFLSFATYILGHFLRTSQGWNWVPPSDFMRVS